MGQTDHGQIGRKLKGARWNLKYKTASKGSKINTHLIGYVTKIHVKNKQERTQTRWYFC